MAFYSNGSDISDQLIPALMFTDNYPISCGYNAQGQLGLNNTSNYSSFQAIPSITNIKQIVGGGIIIH